MPRLPIKKSVRFDVFNRDSFTCRYCGKTPPEVVLHIDHLVPVARGGTNDIENLLTACLPCNSGKGVKNLQDSPPNPDVNKRLMELSQDRSEMLIYLQEWKNRQEVQQTLIEHFQLYWGKCMGSDEAPSNSVIERWVRVFDPSVIEEAILIVSGKVASGKLQLWPDWKFTEATKYTVGVMKRLSGDHANG